jgi:hypothetical protein
VQVRSSHRPAPTLRSGDFYTRCDPELRIRDIANLVGITERATVQILNQLEASGYLTKTRVGRRNHYTVHGELPLRHPLNNGRQVGELLRVIEPEIPPPAARSRPH